MSGLCYELKYWLMRTSFVTFSAVSQATRNRFGPVVSAHLMFLEWQDGRTISVSSSQTFCPHKSQHAFPGGDPLCFRTSPLPASRSLGNRQEFHSNIKLMLNAATGDANLVEAASAESWCTLVNTARFQRLYCFLWVSCTNENCLRVLFTFSKPKMF